MALTDAVARARGKAFQDLHSSRYGTNPAMMKIYLANMLGWTDRTEGMEDDKPPPQVTVVVQPSGNGKGGNGQTLNVHSNGHKKGKGNGKGNGSR